MHGTACKIVVKRVHGEKRHVRVCKRPPLPSAGTVAARIQLSGAEVSVAAGDGTVWATTADGELDRIDPATNSVVTSIALPAAEWPSSVFYGDGAAWVAVASPDTIDHPEQDLLLRVDPATNRVVAQIHVGHSPTAVAFTAGAAWTADHRSETGGPYNQALGKFSVSRVSTTTNSETQRILVETRNAPGLDGNSIYCCGPQGIAAGAGAIWVADPTWRSPGGMVIRLDPVTDRVAAVIPFDQAPACGAVAADDTAVWVAASCERSVITRIDPATNRIVGKADAGATALGLALAPGALWVSTEAGLARIDTATNKVVALTRLSNPGGVAVGSGSVWIGNGTTLLRIDPA